MAGFCCALSGLGNSVYLDYSHIQSPEGASYIYLGASSRELNTMKLPYEMTGNHITCAPALPMAGLCYALSGLGNSVYLDYSHIQSPEGASYIYLGASSRELNTMKPPYEMIGNHITCAPALPMAGLCYALSGLGNSVYLDYSHIQSPEGASYIYLGASPRELYDPKTK